MVHLDEWQCCRCHKTFRCLTRVGKQPYGYQTAIDEDTGRRYVKGLICKKCMDKKDGR